MARYQVTGAAVTAKVDTNDGVQVRYFYAGAVLPESTHDDSIEHLLDVGLIAEWSPTGEPAAPTAKKPAKADPAA